ncbi:MerR family DNA-binding transcriptional regulator [Geomicrobium sp. JCM 19038]|uniref:MerR family transcriptional regulator n=1 Tax=Geomicrobium sp. JCM 19038 TaxID=1460635 RepID=UPI00045F2E4D|nr:MerR family DNA-binding transcriptional regulator [Geomicrobium sp. JCM 19038]GAK06829.1 predicted transcriptional regulator LiuR of leucine degradation pathway, MerR family [Geomicrobium sp. JCM 19038]
MAWTITELAQQFDVTTRTIRFYEEKGLIYPDRTDSGQRMYSKRELVRLRLILRGKRYGFSLSEIAEMIELFDVDRTEQKQLETTITYGKKKVAELNETIESFIALRDEMEEMLVSFENKLQRINNLE